MVLIEAAGNGHVEVVRMLLARGADARERDEDGARALDCAAQNGHSAVVELLLEQDAGLLDLPGYHGRTALAAAAGAGQGEVVGLLLARGADAAARLEDGTRALDWAAAQGHLDVVARLLDGAPQVRDLPGFRERTALLSAAANGRTEVVQLLLTRGADLRSRMENGGHALEWAAARGDAEVAQRLLAADPGLLDLPGAHGFTALMCAAGYGHTDIARSLLALGADPHARADRGDRALDWAAAQGHQEVVELLLAHDPQLLQLPGYNDRTPLMAAAEGGFAALVSGLLGRGADPGLQGAGGIRALDGAAQGGHIEVVTLLLSQDASLLNLPGYHERTALMAAAGGGHVELVSLLLKHGADPRARMSGGTRALDFAAQEGHLEVVEQLLAYDSGLLDLPGDDDCTALIMAAGRGHLALVEGLLSRGADPRAHGQQGEHALDMAAQGGHGDVVDLLLTADPGLLDRPGYHERTALAAGAGNGHSALVGRLLKRGADARARLRDGGRALDWAANEGHLDVVEQLLAHDSTLLDLPGEDGRTALTAAAAAGHVAVVQGLLARGADPRIRMDNGRRALDAAAAGGHTGVVEVLLAHDAGLLDLPGGGDVTALVCAAAGGHVELLRALLARGADPRLGDAKSGRALDAAAQNGHIEALAVLLEHDAGLLDLPGYHERTALAAGAGAGHGELVSLLLARGADPRARLSDGTRALDWAAQGGHREVVELLLAHDIGLVNLPGEDDCTALVMAAGLGRTAVVELLLSRGADPRLRGAQGEGALDAAAQRGSGEVVDLLLAADQGLLNLPGYHERSALAAAAGNGHRALVERLLAAGADPRYRFGRGVHALEWAARSGHVDVVERLLAHDPTLLDLPGARGNTALIAAAGNGCTAVVELLLSRGADPRARDEEGARALDDAAQENHHEIVERLLADDQGLLELPGFHERTALMAAAGGGHAGLVKLLLEKGADPQRRTPSGARALDLAADGGHMHVVLLLLAHDPALLDLPGQGGHTALMVAAAGGHAQLVGLLLERGAQARCCVEDGTHALDWAAQEGHVEVVARLLDHDPASVDLPGCRGRTALMAAVASGHADVVRLLLERGGNPHLSLSDGRNALEVAAGRGHLAVVEMLLNFDSTLL